MTSSPSRENALGIPHGTIRATVLIETIPAAFEMEEILYELRDHCAGLNAGRWDYIFSIIKNFRGRGASFVLPDRSKITMTVPFMRAYTELLVQTCHKRGRARDRRHERVHPEPPRPRGHRAGARAGRGRQAPRGRRRLRRHLGGASGPRSPRPAPSSTRCSATARTRSTASATTCTSTASDLLDLRIDGEVTDAGVRVERVDRASATSRAGCAASAPPRSTTSWRTRRPPRSAARSCGSGSTTGRRSRARAPGSRARARRGAARRRARTRRERPEGDRFDEAAELFREPRARRRLPDLPHDRRRTARYLVEPAVTAALSAISTGPIPRARGAGRLMRIVLVGPPGAGKGTQGERIAAQLRVPRIVVGDVLRQHIARGHAPSASAPAEYVERGRARARPPGGRDRGAGARAAHGGLRARRLPALRHAGTAARPLPAGAGRGARRGPALRGAGRRAHRAARRAGAVRRHPGRDRHPHRRLPGGGGVRSSSTTAVVSSNWTPSATRTRSTTACCGGCGRPRSPPESGSL